MAYELARADLQTSEEHFEFNLASTLQSIFSGIDRFLDTGLTTVETYGISGPEGDRVLLSFNTQADRVLRTLANLRSDLDVWNPGGTRR